VPGQIVVTAGVHVLNPGQKVKFYLDPGPTPVAAVPAVSSVNTSVSVK
jgi:multidrug efflux system membrane fusion protein